MKNESYDKSLMRFRVHIFPVNIENLEKWRNICQQKYILEHPPNIKNWIIDSLNKTKIKFVDDDTLYEYEIEGELTKAKLYELGLVDDDSKTSKWVKQPEEVSIGKAVTSIGDYVFYGCTSLKSVTIPDGVTRILEGAFALCSNLSEITLPVCVTNVGDYAFKSTYNLQTVNIVLNGEDDDNLDKLKRRLISAKVSESVTWNVIQPTT